MLPAVVYIIVKALRVRLAQSWLHPLTIPGAIRRATPASADNARSASPGTTHRLDAGSSAGSQGPVAVEKLGE